MFAQRLYALHDVPVGHHVRVGGVRFQRGAAVLSRFPCHTSGKSRAPLGTQCKALVFAEVCADPVGSILNIAQVHHGPDEGFVRVVGAQRAQQTVGSHQGHALGSAHHVFHAAVHTVAAVGDALGKARADVSAHLGHQGRGRVDAPEVLHCVRHVGADSLHSVYHAGRRVLDALAKALHEVLAGVDGPGDEFFGSFPSLAQEVPDSFETLLDAVPDVREQVRDPFAEVLEERRPRR